MGRTKKEELRRVIGYRSIHRQCSRGGIPANFEHPGQCEHYNLRSLGQLQECADCPRTCVVGAEDVRRFCEVLGNPHRDVEARQGLNNTPITD